MPDSTAEKDLWKQLEDPDYESCEALLKDMLQSRPTLKLLVAARKTFRLQKRHRPDQDWSKLLQLCDTLEKTKPFKPVEEKDDGGLPRTVQIYSQRLRSQKKELYKNPPVLPPSKVVVAAKKEKEPHRNKNGELVFAGGCDAVAQFRPNRSPEQVLRAGAFGGTYFRSIVSAVTNETIAAQAVLNSTVPDSWREGLTAKQLSSQKYDATVNKYGVKCGGSLGMWESSGVGAAA